MWPIEEVFGQFFDVFAKWCEEIAVDPHEMRKAWNLEGLSDLELATREIGVFFDRCEKANLPPKSITKYGLGVTIRQKVAMDFEAWKEKSHRTLMRDLISQGDDKKRIAKVVYFCDEKNGENILCFEMNDGTCNVFSRYGYYGQEQLQNMIRTRPP